MDPATRTDEGVTFTQVGACLSAAAIGKAEETCQLQFPETLRRMYVEIGDGGFGPGYGFLPMTRAKDKHDDTVVELYLSFTSTDSDDPTWVWPKNLVPVVDFGCAIRACVDCANGQVVVSDPNLHDTNWAETFLSQGCTLDEWLSRWCSGEKLWDSIYVRAAT